VGVGRVREGELLRADARVAMPGGPRRAPPHAEAKEEKERGKEEVVEEELATADTNWEKARAHAGVVVGRAENTSAGEREGYGNAATHSLAAEVEEEVRALALSWLRLLLLLLLLVFVVRAEARSVCREVGQGVLARSAAAISECDLGRVGDVTRESPAAFQPHVESPRGSTTVCPETGQPAEDPERGGR